MATSYEELYKKWTGSTPSKKKDSGNTNANASEPNGSKSQNNGGRIKSSYEQMYDKIVNQDVAVDDRYMRNFWSSADRFLRSSEDDLHKMRTTDAKDSYQKKQSEADRLRLQGNAIRRFLERNKDYLDADFYREMTANLNSFNGQRNDTMLILDGERREYDKILSFDADEAQKEIENIEFALSQYKDLSRWETNAQGQKTLESIRQKYGEEDDIKALLNQKKITLSQMKRAQERLGQEKYYSDVRKKPDFAENSIFDGNRDDIGYQYVNADKEGRLELERKYGQYVEEFGYHAYDSLTDKEKQVYNYYMNTGNREAAAEYLKYLQETLNQRKGQQIFEDGYQDRPWLELAFGLEAGLDQFRSGVQGFGSIVAGRDGYVAPSATQYASGQMREDLADDGKHLPDWLGGASWGQVAYDAVTTSANMAPSILASIGVGIINPVAGHVVGSGLMGASAAGNAYQEALNEGYDKDQARGYALLVGGSEIVMEKVLGGIGALGGNALGKVLTKNLSNADTALKMIAKKLGGSMLSEFGEEYLQEVLTPVFQNVALGTDNEVKLVSAEALYSGILGALTAGIMEGPGAVRGEVNTQQQGKALQTADISARRLADIGKTFSVDTVAYQLAGRVNENTGAYTMGRLFNEIDATLTEQNKADIAQYLTSSGMSSEIARKNAEVLAYIVDGGEVSDVQMKLIEKNTILAAAMQEVIINPNSTVNQRSQGFNQVLMSLSNEASGVDTSRTEQDLPGQESQGQPDKVVTENNQPTHSEYETSADGKTILKSTGETVNVKEIATIKDGRMTLKLDDGRSVNAEDVSYASQSEALVYEAVANMGVNASAANVLVNAYHPGSGVSAEVYSHGIKEAYRYGQYNYPMQELAKGPFSSMLTDQQRNTAYKLGKLFGGKQVEKAQAIATNAKRTAEQTSDVDHSADVSKKVGKVHFDGDRSTLTERQSASISALETVADVLGVQIHMFESQVEENGRRTGANGWYDPKDSSIHIDLYAGASGEATMLFTAAHELTHFIKQWSPAKFKTLANFLMTEYGKKGVSVETLVQAQIAKAERNGRTISYDTAYEEVIADSMETMLSDGNVMEKLAKLKQQDKSLWQKIRDFISELAAKIRKVYEGLTPDSAEGRYVADMKDTIEALQDMFTEALVDASENYQSSLTPSVEGVMVNQSGEFVAHSTEVKYSDRDFGDQVDEVLSGKFDRTNAVYVGKTPSILQRVGLNGNLPMLTTARHIKDAVKPKNTKKHHHGLTKEQIKRLPEKIADPVMVLDSKNEGSNSVVVVTDMLDSDRSPVVVTIQADGKGMYNNVEIDTNFATSYYGRDGFAKFVENNAKADNFLYINGKKATALSTESSTQWLEQLKNYDFDTIIRTTRANVKKYSGRDYSYEALTSKPDMTVTMVDGNVPKNRADVVALAKKNAAKVGKVDPKTGSVSVHVADINSDVLLSTDGLKHGLRRTKNPETDANYITTLKAGEIIKNSIKINEANPKKQNATGAYVLIGAARNASGDIYIVRSIVNHFKNELDSMDVLYAINAKKELAALNAPRSTAEPLSVTSSTISIAELMDHVNQYFPDILPEEVLKHYGYDARPEGDFGENVLYSDRDTESVSNRSLLANAFESVAQNDIERQKIQEYKGKVDLINTEEQKLRSLNEQIKELSFAKGPKDTAKIRELQFEAKQTANRINTYDRQLLRLEASKPLQDVLDREKKAAYKRAEQKGKQALAAYRERAAKTQQELLKRYQESRKKGIESREKTAMRHKIKDVVNELNQYLLKGDKDKRVMMSLKKAVAEALDAVNMDTVGAEERIAKLQAEMMKAKIPEQIQAIAKKIEHIQQMGDKMSNRLKALKDAYREIAESDDPLIANAHDDVIEAKLESVIEKVGNTALRDMNLEQLNEVYDMYRMVLTTIRNSNKAFKAAKNETIATLGNRVMEEVEQVGGKKRYSTKIMDGIKKFGWNNLKPVYAFEHIGSKTFTEIFKNVRAGEDVWAKDVTEARKFYLDKVKKYNFDSWKMDLWHSFTSTSGMDFSLNLEQIMSLYAYSKRDQAADHLRRGGIVIDESTEITMKTKLGIKVKFNPTEATAYNISDETLQEIISKLTPEQKGFVDEMQEYLSTTMGNKGNEVSLELYGIKLFKEKFYFPLKSASQFMAKAKEQQQGEVKIKNSGFSKETVKKASNPIVLTPFMNVWASHVNEMSMYHAFVLPMEDFYRVYNYRTPTSDSMATESVEMFIQNAYGKGATRYIDQLLKDLNGGARTDSTTGVINNLMGKFKKGAVFASASVVIQQPSAIARAAAMVDLKYFVGPKVDHKRHKLLWDEVKRYAPVAIIKEMGYFDTNMGKSTEDFLLGKEYSGIKEKATALVKDSDYRDEILSKAPALADEITWCAIWEAVKRETKAKNPGMDVKSDAFLQKAGERFTEVIVKTQVYDSVLSRSANMRSKDTGMKMATAFMAEPTTAINMVTDALLKAKRGDKRSARKAIGSVVAAQILNAFLVSWVYAARDDDEDETYREKYIGTFAAEVLDGINPATYIPFIKDIVSIVQGYDVERSDMAVVSDLWNAWNQLESEDVSAWRKVEGFVGSICQMFGLPVKNIMRDVRSLLQTYDTIVHGEKNTTRGTAYAIVEGLTGEKDSNPEQLYKARLKGDEEHAARVEARYDDEDSANAAVRKAITDRYMDGKLTLAQATMQLTQYAGMDADEAYWLMDGWKYKKETGSDEGYSKYNDLYEAVRTGKDLKAVIKVYTDNGVKAKTLSSQITEHFKSEYVELSASERAGLKGYLVNAYEQCGVSREDAEGKLRDWDFEAKYGFKYSDRKSAYLEGKISSQVLKTVLVDEGGYSEEDAAYQIEAYEWEKEGIEGATTAAIRNYNAYCKDAGIPRDLYMKIRTFSNNTENDVDENGKKIAYSAMKKIMAEINSLNVTNAQKDALARSMGWKESNIKKYKLWD